MKNILILMIVTILSVSPLKAEEEVVKKVVYNLTTGDVKKLENYILSGIVAHKTYYQNKLQELDVRVVIHGDAYKFFMKDLNNTAYKYQKDLVEKQEALQKRLSSLAKQYEVKFFVCEVGVKSRNLNPKAFYPFVSMVHNAGIGLIDAQNDGYAYLSVD